MRQRDLLPVQRDRRSRGFTLIEVLVAMTILSIGVLGVTAMQLSSIGGQVSTRKLDSCANLVADVLARIRANAANVDDYNGFDPSGGGSGIFGDDMAALAQDMNLMRVPASATLTADVESNSPVPGVSTVTAYMIWDSNATGPLCSAVDVIRRDQ